MHGGSGGEAVINGCRSRLRPCDSCKAAAAALFCLDDSAFLCFGCDDGIHGANRLPKLRHGRVWLCDVCEDAPAAVTCEADAASLCASCDSDIHSANTIASRRLRHHVEPSFGYSAQCVGECVSSFPQHVGVVPENGTTMTTNCEPNMSYASLGSVDASTADPSNTTVTSAPLVTPFCGVNRKARVLRYKEKRKNREFKKTIRYTSRKAYAEMRPRVKGRFAKRTTKSEQELVNNVFGTSTAVIGNNDFGVVPT